MAGKNKRGFVSTLAGCSAPATFIPSPRKEEDRCRSFLLMLTPSLSGCHFSEAGWYLCALGLAVLGRHWERIKPARLSLSGNDELGVLPTPCQSEGKSFHRLNSAEFTYPGRSGKTVFPQINPEALYRDPKWDEDWHGDRDVLLLLRYNVRERKSSPCCSICNGREGARALTFYFILLLSSS